MSAVEGEPKKPHPTRAEVLVREEHQIVQAAGQIGVWTLLSRVTGLIRDMLIAGLFGAGAVTDAFFVAFRIPNLLRRLVGEGTSNAALIPVVTEYMLHHSRTETQDMLRALLGVTSGVLLVLTGIGIVCAAPLVRIFAPGFGPHLLALTVALTEITFVYLFCVGLLALATGVLHTQRHFSAPAFAPVLLNIAIIGCALGLSRFLIQPVFSLAYGVVLGGVLQVAWQMPILGRLGLLLRPRWQPHHPAIVQVGTLLVPVVFGAAVYQLGLVVNTVLASLLGTGSVSALWYASRLFEFPQGIIVAALASATLPSLATRAQQRDLVGVAESLGFALRVTNIVVVPTTLGLFVLAVPITASLFFRGAFGADQVIHTASILQAFVVGLWPIAVSRLLVSCLYALGDTHTPVRIAGLALVAHVCFSLVLVGSLGVPDDASGLAYLFARLSASVALCDYGLVGLGLASSLGTILNMLLLAFVGPRRLPQFPWSSWLASLAWSLLSSAVMIGPVWLLARQIQWLDPDLSVLGRLAMLLAAIGIGVASFSVLIWWGRKSDMKALTGLLSKRLLGRLPQLF